jgi:hypothetical protein
MRAVVGRGALVLPFLAPGSALADRLDSVTFDAPPGWNRQAIAAGLLFEAPRARGGGFCHFLLGKTLRAVRPLADELDRAWASLLGSQSVIGEVATPAQSSLGNGVALAQRMAQVQAGERSYVMVLNLLLQGDRLVMVAANAADASALDRCAPAIGDFIAGVTFDLMPGAQPPPTAMPAAGGSQASVAPPPRSDPQLAARFGNSVVGSWRYALTAVTVNLNAPTQTRNAIDIRFAPDGAYRITYRVTIPGASMYSQSETGTYRVDGPRIRMQPTLTAGGPRPYTLDWFFGDHPDYRGNWGLILRASVDWTGGDKDSWRTFKPVE